MNNLRLVIKNATVIDGDGSLQSNVNIAVANSVIVAVTPGELDITGAKVINGSCDVAVR